MSTARPPRLASWLSARLTPASEREWMLGDLDEAFHRDVRRRGVAAARRAYWRQTLALFRHRVPSGPRPRTAQGATLLRGIDMTQVFKDMVIGARTIMRMPSYSAVTILTLALAIGANTVIFSLVSPLVVRPLPIADPDGLGWIRSINLERQIDRGAVSVPDFLDYRQRARSFASLAAYENASGTLSGHHPDPERVTLIRGTANFTEVWGMTPALGRLFQPGDDAPGQPVPAVLSMRYFRERFNADPSIIGRQWLLDGRPLVVVGVMPSSLELGNLALVDLWVPRAMDPSAPRDARVLRVLGRLAPGATVDSANAEVAGIARQTAETHAATHAGWQAAVVTTREALTSSDTWVLMLLLGIVVAFVLLIACANLANLVTTRLASHRVELAVRQALGASRWQLARPLLVESLLLAAAGGVCGVLVAHGGLAVVNAAAYEPYLKNVTIDGYVLVFAALVSILTPALFALWPALSAGRHVAATALRDARSGGGRAATRKRHILVTSQVALALSLLVISMLAVRSMLHLRSIAPGLDLTRVAFFRYELPEDRYATPASRVAFADALAARLAATGGVDHAAVASHLPVFDGELTRVVNGVAREASVQDPPWVSWYAVTPGFFPAAGVRLVAGRVLNDADRDGREPVTVLNRLAATRYFGGADQALGRRISLAGRNEAPREVTIVGVVTDTTAPVLTTTSPQAYVPFAQWPSAAMTAVARAARPADRLNDLRAAMRAMDPAVPITELRTLADKNDDELSGTAVINGLFVAFAAIALALAAGGLYGVISYSVGQRSREIGLRMALGAMPAGIWRMVLHEGLRVTGRGLVIGVVLGLGMASLARPILIGVSPTDPLTFGAVTLTVLIVAVGSILPPAWRAMRTDPARTLRGE